MTLPYVIIVISGLTIFLWVFYGLRILFIHRLKVKERILAIIDDKKNKLEEDPYSLPFKERIIKPFVQKAEKSIMKWAPMTIKRKEQELLMLAGFPHHLTIQEWMVLRTLFWIVFGAMFTMMGWGQESLMMKIEISFIGWVLGYQLPIFYLKKRKENRKKEIKQGLPYVLDILTVSVEAGLGFDASLSKVVEKTTGALTQEFQKTLQEIKMGKSRKEALKDLGHRNSSDDMLQFVGSIIQAEQLGIRLGNVLRVQSEDMRQKRKQRAEEKAMKAPVKILFPLILFIFPAIFIIVLGPAMIHMMESLFH